MSNATGTVEYWDGSKPVTMSKERSDALIYAENRLRPWAHWIRDTRETLGFPTVSLLYKAMRRKAVRLRRGGPGTNPMHRDTDHRTLGGPEFTATGKESHSFQPARVIEPPEAVAEVDHVVASLPAELRDVVVADFFVYGPIEVRAKSIGLKRATYVNLLRAAKYAVFTGLHCRHADAA